MFSLRTLQLLGNEKNGEFLRKTLENSHLGKEILYVSEKKRCKTQKEFKKSGKICKKI